MEIQDADAVTIIWDGWSTNYTRQRKIAFVVRLVTKGEKNFKQYMLDLVPLDGRETGETLTKVFKRVLLYFGLAEPISPGFDKYTVYNPHLGEEVMLLPLSESALGDLVDVEVKFASKLVGTVTDSCDVMLKSANMIGGIRLGCLLHALHNVVGPALKDSDFLAFWDLLIEILKFIKRSGLIQSLISDIQIILDMETEVTVVVLSESRWIGIPKVGARVLHLWPVLAKVEEAFRQHPSINQEFVTRMGPDKVFTSQNKKNLQQVLLLLKPFVALTEEFLGSNNAPPTSIFKAGPAIIRAYQQLVYLVLKVTIEDSSASRSGSPPQVDIGRT